MPVGTIRKFTIEGISYNVAGDADLSLKPNSYENSKIPTSGDAMTKQERVVATCEGVVLIITPSQLAELVSFADDPSDKQMSFTERDGSEWKSQGTFNIENRTTMEGRASLQLHPTTDWTLFPA